MLICKYGICIGVFGNCLNKQGMAVILQYNKGYVIIIIFIMYTVVRILSVKNTRIGSDLL